MLEYYIWEGFFTAFVTWLVIKDQGYKNKAFWLTVIAIIWPWFWWLVLEAGIVKFLNRK